MKPTDKKKYKAVIGVREKVLIVATVIVLVALSYKSIYMDAYAPEATDDLVLIENYIDEQYDGIFYESGLLKIRIINFNNVENEAKLHLRKYLFGIVPIGDIYTIVD
jgi:hypothetical protein